MDSLIEVVVTEKVLEKHPARDWGNTRPHLASILDGHFVAGYESGTDLVTSNLDCFSDHLTSKLDGFGDHRDSILGACNLSHLASILDALISNLPQIIARFDIKASKIEAR